MLKSKLTFFALLLIPLILGIAVVGFWNKKHDLKVQSYKGGDIVFSDRCYADELRPELLDEYLLVSLPRHFHYDISIQSNAEFEVIRLTSEANNNEFISGWEMLKDKVNIPGKSSAFTSIYRKNYKEGLYHFSSGGPVATTPILLKGNGRFNAFYTTNYLFPDGLLASKTNLLLLISLYLNYVMFLLVFRFQAKQSYK